MNIDKDKKISPDVLILISEEAARYYKMIPLSLAGNVLDVGLVDPDDVKAQEALNFLASRNGLVTQVFKITEDGIRDPDYEPAVPAKTEKKE
mgnify:CR=1 FL=1